MSKHAKYLFETSFDDDRSAPNPEVEAAFARGHEAGVEAARSQSEQMVAQAAVKIVDRLSSLEAVRSELGARMSRQAIMVASDLVRKMMPALVERGGMAEIEAVLQGALKRMIEEPRVVFRVPDAMLDILQPRISEMSSKAGYSGEVVLLADDQMGLSDCLVEWADGGAERNVDRLWSEVEELLTRTLEAQPAGATPIVFDDAVPTAPDFDAAAFDANAPAAIEQPIAQSAPMPDDPSNPSPSNPGVSSDG